MSFLKRKNPAALDLPGLLAELEAQTGRGGRVLASATGPHVVVLALEDRLAVRRGEEQWVVFGWHMVKTGGWKSERDELHWRLLDGSKDAVQLTEPGQVPQVFRDRVQSSIAVQDVFDVPGGGSLVLAARRDLGSDAPELIWTVDAVRGARLDDAETRALADEALAQLRADYDF